MIELLDRTIDLQGKIREWQENEKGKVSGPHLAQMLVWEARCQAWLWLSLKWASGEFILPSAGLCVWWQQRVGGVSLSLGSSIWVAWASNKTPSFLALPSDWPFMSGTGRRPVVPRVARGQKWSSTKKLKESLGRTTTPGASLTWVQTLISQPPRLSLLKNKKHIFLLIMLL